jgi:hypothetical protein
VYSNSAATAVAQVGAPRALIGKVPRYDNVFERQWKVTIAHSEGIDAAAASWTLVRPVAANGRVRDDITAFDSDTSAVNVNATACGIPTLVGRSSYGGIVKDIGIRDVGLRRVAVKVFDKYSSTITTPAGASAHRGISTNDPIAAHDDAPKGEVALHQCNPAAKRIGVWRTTVVACAGGAACLGKVIDELRVLYYNVALIDI